MHEAATVARSAFWLIVLGSALVLGQRAAPDFVLEDLQGRKHRLAEHAGGILVLEWTSPECPVVQARHAGGGLAALVTRCREKGAQWLSVASGRAARPGILAAWRKEQGVRHPCLLDPTGKTARAFGAKKTPQVFVVHRGRIVYEGALDDGKPGVPATRNHVLAAIDEIRAGRPVSMPRTEPHGCGIATAPPPSAGKPRWHVSYAEARAEAKRSGRPILANFTGSDWCHWCHKLDEDVLATPGFAQWARGRVVLLTVDFPMKVPQPVELKRQNERLREAFAVTGYPTLVFVDAEGGELGRVDYQPTVEAWIAKAEAVLGDG